MLECLILVDTRKIPQSHFKLSPWWISKFTLVKYKGVLRWGSSLGHIHYYAETVLNKQNIVDFINSYKHLNYHYLPILTIEKKNVGSFLEDPAFIYDEGKFLEGITIDNFNI